MAVYECISLELWCRRRLSEDSELVCIYKQQAQESLAAAIRFATNSNCMLDLLVQPELNILLKS